MKRANIVKEAKITHVAASALLLLAGVMFMAWADLDKEAVRWILGGVFALMGGARILGYFANDLYRLAFQYDLALGVFCIIFGVLIVISPARALIALPYGIGLYVLLDGLLRMQTALDAKAFGMKQWWGLLTSSTLVGIFGVLVLLGMGSGVFSSQLLFGLALALDGAENVWNTMGTMRVRVKAKERHDDYEKLL